MQQSDFQMRNMKGEKKNKLKATDDKSPTSIKKKEKRSTTAEQIKEKTKKKKKTWND